MSDQQIVAAALQLIRREGAERLSMRKLAKELGVTPMAIYYYVPNKDALFDRISDAVLAQVPRPAPTGRDWQREFSTYAVQGWRLLLEYPGLAAQLAKRPASAQSDELARYGISILVAAGFDTQDAALAITSYHAFMMGVIDMQAQIAQRRRSRRKPSELAQYLRQLDFRELVDYGIAAIVGGLDARLRAGAAGKRRRQHPRRARAQLV